MLYSKTFLFKVFCFSFLVLTISCDSDDDQNNDDENPFSDFETFIVGYDEIGDDNIAFLWADGTPIDISGGDINTRATDVAISDRGDVYISVNKYTPTRAEILKNGEPFFVTNETDKASINDVFVLGDDIYACGTVVRNETVVAAYWKNNIVTVLSNYETSNSYSISIKNEDVYVCGNVFSSPYSRAAYWKNGVLTVLNNEDYRTNTSKIIVDNGDVHIIGNGFNQQPLSIYWKNGVEVIVGDPLENSEYWFSDLYVNETDVYITGRNNSNGFDAVLWKNGESTVLNSANRGGYATNVVISNNDLYVMGLTSEVATNDEGEPALSDNQAAIKIWKNNNELYSYDVTTDVWLSAMAVRN